MFRQKNGNFLDNEFKIDEKLVKEYKLSQTDLLGDSFQKRANVRDCRGRLSTLITKLENYDFLDVWTIEKITEELK